MIKSSSEYNQIPIDQHKQDRFPFLERLFKKTRNLFNIGQIEGRRDFLKNSAIGVGAILLSEAGVSLVSGQERQTSGEYLPPHHEFLTQMSENIKNFESGELENIDKIIEQVQAELKKFHPKTSFKLHIRFRDIDSGEVEDTGSGKIKIAFTKEVVVEIKKGEVIIDDQRALPYFTVGKTPPEGMSKISTLEELIPLISTDTLSGSNQFVSLELNSEAEFILDKNEFPADELGTHLLEELASDREAVSPFDDFIVSESTSSRIDNLVEPWKLEEVDLEQTVMVKVRSSADSDSFNLDLRIGDHSPILAVDTSKFDEKNETAEGIMIVSERPILNVKYDSSNQRSVVRLIFPKPGLDNHSNPSTMTTDIRDLSSSSSLYDVTRNLLGYFSTNNS